MILGCYHIVVVFPPFQGLPLWFGPLYSRRILFVCSGSAGLSPVASHSRIWTRVPSCVDKKTSGTRVNYLNRSGNLAYVGRVPTILYRNRTDSQTLQSTRPSDQRIVVPWRLESEIKRKTLLLIYNQGKCHGIFVFLLILITIKLKYFKWLSILFIKEYFVFIYFTKRKHFTVKFSFHTTNNWIL